jgi:preprotein translocase subunit YajC
VYTTTLMATIVAQNGDGTTDGGGSILGLLLPALILGGIFYFVFVVPQRRRMRSIEQMRESVEVGDEIRTVGGIYGTVRSMDDESMTVDVGGGTVIRFSRRAIAGKVEAAGEAET